MTPPTNRLVVFDPTSASTQHTRTHKHKGAAAGRDGGGAWPASLIGRRVEPLPPLHINRSKRSGHSPPPPKPPQPIPLYLLHDASVPVLNVPGGQGQVRLQKCGRFLLQPGALNMGPQKGPPTQLNGLFMADNESTTFENRSSPMYLELAPQPQALLPLPYDLKVEVEEKKCDSTVSESSTPPVLRRGDEVTPDPPTPVPVRNSFLSEIHRKFIREARSVAYISKEPIVHHIDGMDIEEYPNGLPEKTKRKRGRPKLRVVSFSESIGPPNETPPVKEDSIDDPALEDGAEVKTRKKRRGEVDSLMFMDFGPVNGGTLWQQQREGGSLGESVTSPGESGSDYEDEPARKRNPQRASKEKAAKRLEGDESHRRPTSSRGKEKEVTTPGEYTRNTRRLTRSKKSTTPAQAEPAPAPEVEANLDQPGPSRLVCPEVLAPTPSKSPTPVRNNKKSSSPIKKKSITPKVPKKKKMPPKRAGRASLEVPPELEAAPAEEQPALEPMETTPVPEAPASKKGRRTSSVVAQESAPSEVATDSDAPSLKRARRTPSSAAPALESSETPPVLEAAPPKKGRRTPYVGVPALESPSPEVSPVSETSQEQTDQTPPVLERSPPKQIERTPPVSKAKKTSQSHSEMAPVLVASPPKQADQTYFEHAPVLERSPPKQTGRTPTKVPTILVASPSRQAPQTHPEIAPILERSPPMHPVLVASPPKHLERTPPVFSPPAPTGRLQTPVLEASLQNPALLESSSTVVTTVPPPVLASATFTMPTPPVALPPPVLAAPPTPVMTPTFATPTPTFATPTPTPTPPSTSSSASFSLRPADVPPDCVTSKKSFAEWTCDETAEWVMYITKSEAASRAVIQHEIDGKVLMEISMDELKSNLAMPFGPFVKIRIALPKAMEENP
ncbi:unnamed protein product [Caenorhabditis auriculariae]|uniref:SAM domain-containing protein n=1 Tax=Caenorhabditis auriculariae TaxID=2777116 RepID=A0A8S1HL77_9PELO|nr:unnamed protein product [Caenorhabditis auriculariae]